jgi:hypothetical protein
MCDYSGDLRIQRVTHRALTAATARPHVRGAPERNVRLIKIMKEIVMNTSKVIELGKVSEETKGAGHGIESVFNPARQGGAG